MWLSRLFPMMIFVTLLEGSYAQSPFEESNNSPRPCFSSILVQDIEISSKWYSELLELEEKDRKALQDRGIEIVNLFNEEFQLELVEMAGLLWAQEVLVRENANKRMGGLFKIGFEVDEFDKWSQKVEKLQIELQGSIVEDPISGKRTVVVLDPDGNRIQFFEK